VRMISPVAGFSTAISSAAAAGCGSRSTVAISL
jgi:hypothetical protein